MPDTKPKKKTRPNNLPRSKRADKNQLVTVVEYNALWEEYQRSQSTIKAAEFSGVNYDTARKYITGPGDPERGFMPIAHRWRVLQTQRQHVEVITLTAYRRAEIATIANMLAVLRGEFKIAAGDVESRLEAYRHAREAAAASGQPSPRGERELTLDKLMASYEKISRLGEHYLGGPDQIHAMARDPLDEVSEEEAKLYITRGVVPAGMRNSGADNAKHARERGEE
jgi:hypothetical protein